MGVAIYIYKQDFPYCNLWAKTWLYYDLILSFLMIIQMVMEWKMHIKKSNHVGQFLIKKIHFEEQLVYEGIQKRILLKTVNLLSKPSIFKKFENHISVLNTNEIFSEDQLKFIERGHGCDNPNKEIEL